jgi:hypothetical protein
MSEEKHTPGPWLADGASVYEERDDFSVICNFWSSSLPEWEDNARLIAAAPDLLEALKMADAALRGANMNMAVMQRKIEAAIAKAKGGDK